MSQHISDTSTNEGDTHAHQEEQAVIVDKIQGTGKHGTKWMWEWSGGKFEVEFNKNGTFFCNDYPRHARWKVNGDELVIDWADLGTYVMTVDSSTGHETMEGCYRGYPKEWRKAVCMGDLDRTSSMDDLPTEILVCQAGTCRRMGSQAVLMEIEELAGAVGTKCKVRGSHCLGYCSQAPNAMVLRNQHTKKKVHTRIDSLRKSAAVVKSATGEMPPVDDPLIEKRLEGVRAIRAHERAVLVHRWNDALKAVAAQGSAYLKRTSQQLFAMAGFDAGPSTSPDMPIAIEAYSQWSLEQITKVSKHSAVLHFSSTDCDRHIAMEMRKRGTPNPRMGYRVLPNPKTWHTTLLAEVGRNDEGPLPWIERDYTPISTALEWERGQCALLIKFYPDGDATSWLRRIVESTASGSSARVWLAKPVQTLSVPALVSRNSAFSPASVLLLLGGTGVVALPQILQHRDPQRNLGISTRKEHQLHVPIDLILSCRADDVLLLPEVTRLCREGCDADSQDPRGCDGTKGLRRCTLLLTGTTSADRHPFPDGNDCEDELIQLQSLPNTQALRTRLTVKLVSEAVSRMPRPCRVVVSGPEGFNAAAREMLLAANVAEGAISVLEA